MFNSRTRSSQEIDVLRDIGAFTVLFLGAVSIIRLDGRINRNKKRKLPIVIESNEDSKDE